MTSKQPRAEWVSCWKSWVQFQVRLKIFRLWFRDVLSLLGKGRIWSLHTMLILQDPRERVFWFRWCFFVPTVCAIKMFVLNMNDKLFENRTNKQTSSDLNTSINPLRFFKDGKTQESPSLQPSQIFNLS